MTWPKFGSEFPAQCAEADLSDAAFRTHTEAICYLYEVESQSLEIRKGRLRTIALSPNWEAAAAELVAKEFWLEAANGYRVVHHADVIRQSLAAQQSKRERDKKAQKTFRDKPKSGNDVSADVSADVIPDTDRQTNKPKRESSFEAADEQIDWVTGEVFPSSACSECAQPLTTLRQQQNGMCNGCWRFADGQRKAAVS